MLDGDGPSPGILPERWFKLSVRTPGRAHVQSKASPYAEATALLRAHDFDGAIRACRKLLRRQANDPQALHLLVSAQLDAGHLDDAVTGARRLAALAPGNPSALALLGRALLQRGAGGEAVEVLGEATRLAPGQAVAWHMLGLAHKMSGDLDGAIDAFAEAHRLAPGNPTPLYNFALALIENGRAPEAERLCHAALESIGRTPELLHALGLALLTQERGHEAVRVLEQATALKPDDPGLRTDYGSALASLGDQYDGIVELRTALRLDPAARVARENLVRALQGIGEIDQALEELERLVAMPGYRGNPALERAGLLTVLGRHAESLALATPHLDDPAHALDAATVLASGAHKTGHEDAAIERLDRLVAETDFDSAAETVRDKLIKLDFHLGQLRDARGDVSGAFAAYARGNRRRRVPYDREEHRALVERTVATYGGEAFATLPRAPRGEGMPVFIVGMPRSGTSLLEQMLDSHPLVHGAGELASIGNLARRLELEYAGTFPELAGRLDATRLTDMASDHLAFLSGLSGGLERVTDKMPGNYLHLGLIAQLFPHARVIHCRRTPQDTALSIFFQNFTNYRALAYANDLADIGFHYHQYLRLMAHWESALPLPLLTVDYERVVDDPEGATRELCAFLDLDWDERMLRFHESKRVVVTASSQQVREQLYSTSVARWERYREFLAPLEEELAKPADAA